MVERNYEVSVWTLQDSFLATLKPLNVDYKGQIQSNPVILKDDGTLSYSFSIPMYVYEGTERIINPIWYTTKDGTIAETMRKIKYIVNKGEPSEQVFEFEITNVSEHHESDTTLFCDVETSGLFFEELGKTGYKISLSGEMFYDEDYKWFTKERDEEGHIIVPNQPHATLSYWNNKVLERWTGENVNAAQWYYDIQMDHSGYGQEGMYSDEVYEDEYVSSWNDDGTPASIETFKVKERLIDIEESNIYNITQKIAETFGVFCRYEYLYDDNYHIIGRKVVYYNNFIREREGYLDITYPYNSSNITRTRDGADIATKLFVRSVENGFSDSGLTSITTAAPNKSLEDYILNFDYLYSIGTISKEQYEYIEEYETQMRAYNKDLITLEQQLIDLESKLPEYEAQQTVLQNSVTLDKEAIASSSALFNAITGGTGTIIIGPSAPDTAVLLEDSSSNYSVKTYYLKTSRQGIIPETLKIYATHMGSTVTNEIKGTPVLDEFGGVAKVTNIIKPSDSILVYLTYEYSPSLYYEKVKKVWESKLATDQNDLTKYDELVATTKEEVKLKRIAYNNLLEEKQTLVKDFEHIMGPALREGYWQPDDYQDYGAKFIDSIQLNARAEDKAGSTPYASLIWDDKLFEEEQDIKYKIGVGQEDKYYLCINLSSVWAQVKDKLDEISFIFFDFNNTPIYPYTPRNARSFGIGSQCELVFIKNNGSVIPALLITGATSMTDSEIQYMRSTAQFGIMKSTYNPSTQSIEINITDNVDLSGLWYALSDNTKIVYPRIRINNLLMKNVSDETAIKYNDIRLDEYTDYYVLSRDDSYYITIRPKAIFKQADLTKIFSFKYTISNADTYIYLDGLKVAKENAYPKVSYDVNLSAVNPNLLKTIYSLLGRVANINDTDLKLENVQGYISEIEMNPDDMSQDSVVIKNYRNKFEDLFSSIVAQTEEMKKSAYAISVVESGFNADGSFTTDTLAKSVTSNRPLLDQYLNASLDDDSVVNKMLKNAFDEAGDILKAASDSIEGLHALTTTSGGILASFYENARLALTPTQYEQSTRPVNFKPGDIWKDTSTGNIYIATSYSDASQNDGGWNRTYDGSLASIIGAGIDIDAAEGTIDLKAGSKITLKAKSVLDLASGDIQITGNNSVNIGSKWINIGTLDGGIRIINTQVTEDTTDDGQGSLGTSMITITRGGIDMAAENGITLRAAKAIDIKSADDSDISAIRVNRTEGIYLGSTQPIILFSGALPTSGTNGSAVKLSNEEILFGVSSTGAATVVDMTKDYLILSASDQKEGLKDSNITINGSLTGVKITKCSIGLAIGAGDTRSTILMNKDDGVIIASGDNINTSTHTGSYVQIKPTGIDLGANGDLYLNTSNVQLQTNTDAGTRFALGTNLKSENPDIKLIFDGDGDLTVTGQINASSGKIGGTTNPWNIATGRLYSGSGVTYVALDSGASGTSKDSYAIWAGSTEPSSAPFSVTRGGKLKATDVDIKGAITATSLKIGNESIDDYIDERIPETDGTKITGTFFTADANAGTIRMNADKTLSMSGGNVYIRNANNTANAITLAPSGIIMNGTSITLNSSGALTVNGGNVTISGSGNLDMSSGGNITMNANRQITLGNWKLDRYGLIWSDGSTGSLRIMISANEREIWYDALGFNVTYGSDATHDTYITGDHLYLAGTSNSQVVRIGKAPGESSYGTDYNDTCIVNMSSDRDIQTFGNIGTYKRPWDMIYCRDISKTSSRSFKENIKDVFDVSDIIDKLHPVKYNFKGRDAKRPTYGFLFEEVYPIAPELCDGTKDSKGGLFYDSFIPLLVSEVQHLRARIALLEGTKK